MTDITLTEFAREAEGAGLPGVKRTKSDKRKKAKKILVKVAQVARNAFDIYAALKGRKDPVGLLLGGVSLYESISSLFEKEKPEPANYLKDIGATLVFRRMRSFIFHTLRQMDVPSKKCWDNADQAEERDSEKIEEFDLGEGVYVWFVMGEAGENVVDPSDGPYAMSQEDFVRRFSAIVREKLGDIVGMETFTSGWDEFYYLDGLEIPTEQYVSPIDEAELLRRIRELQGRGFNRAVLMLGSPGVGKTTMAARLARRMGGSMLVASAKVLDGGRGRMLVENLVDIIDPDVVLFDDMDKMWRPNDLLDTMERFNRKDGMRKRLLVATVNSLHDIPRPMRRPGRFDEIVEFPDPDLVQRKAIMAMYLRGLECAIGNEELDLLAEQTEGMTGAFLKEVALRFSVIPLERLEYEIYQMLRFCNMLEEDEEEPESENETKGSTKRYRRRRLKGWRTVKAKTQGKGGSRVTPSGS